MVQCTQVCLHLIALLQVMRFMEAFADTFVLKVAEGYQHPPTQTPGIWVHSNISIFHWCSQLRHLFDTMMAFRPLTAGCLLIRDRGSICAALHPQTLVALLWLDARTFRTRSKPRLSVVAVVHQRRNIYYSKFRRNKALI